MQSKLPNRWEEDLFAANQVPDVTVRQEEIRRNTREIMSDKFPESLGLPPSEL